MPGDGGGYDAALFVEPPTGNIASKLQCPICVQFFRRPVQCSNGHAACAGCIAALKKCPTCRVDLTTPVPSIALRERIDEYQVRCVHSGDGGCMWVGVPSDLDTHLSKCDWRLIMCAVPGCAARITARGVFSHNVDMAQTHAELAVNTAVVLEKRKRQVVDLVAKVAKLSKEVEKVQQKRKKNQHVFTSVFGGPVRTT